MSAPSIRTTRGDRTPGKTSRAASRSSNPRQNCRSSCCRNSAPANTAPKFRPCCRKSGPGLFEPVGRRSPGVRAASGAARPVKDRVVVLSASDHVLPPLGNKMPDGVIIGARGSNGQFAEEPDQRLVRGGSARRNGTLPVQPPTAPRKPARAENRHRKGDGGQWRQEAHQRRDGGGHGRHRMGCARPATSSSRSATDIRPSSRTPRGGRSGIRTPRWCAWSTSSTLPPSA